MKPTKEQVVANVYNQFKILAPNLDERSTRLWAGTMSESLGRGGASRVAEATGLSRVTIRRGVREAREQASLPRSQRGADRIRECGGGRKSVVEEQSGLKEKLHGLLFSATRGDPMSPLLWTSKSTRRLASELKKSGYSVAHRTICSLLREMGYTLQRNIKTLEGKQHDDRDA